MKCADCGADIIELPAASGRWASVGIGSNVGGDGETLFEFCCRVTYDTSKGEPYAVERVDYHHPEGTEQRHFTRSSGGEH